MKKITKIFAVAALFTAMATVSANAQVYFGVKAGTNLTTTSVNIKDVKSVQLSKDSGDYGYQAGIVVGAKVPIIGLGIEAEGLWVNSKIDFGDGGKVHSNSIEVPVMAVIPVPILPITVKAGPSFMLHNDAKVKYADGKEMEVGPVKSSIGYTLGLGLKISKITADLRFNGQFKSEKPFEKMIDGLNIENTLSQYDLRANSFSLSLGYRF